jgi:16S rRNA (guanine527-N7)-methyltransferase
MAHKNKKNHSPYKARQDRKPAPGSHTSETQRKQGHHKKPTQIYSVDEADERLNDLFFNHDFHLVNHQQRRQLARFYVILMEQQKHDNFTRLLSLKDIGIKHFIDSLIITKYTELQFPLIDIGTGPGFPGIPLKILYPQEKILLAEGVQKRVEFLKKVRESLGVSNCDIVGRNIDKYFAYPLRGAITRAVEDISNTLNNIQGSLEKGGRVYFMKGPGVDPELERAEKTWSHAFRLVQDIAYDIPRTQNNRRLIVYEKLTEPGLFENDPSEDILLDELSSAERKRWSQYL